MKSVRDTRKIIADSKLGQSTGSDSKINEGYLRSYIQYKHMNALYVYRYVFKVGQINFNNKL